MTSGTEIERLHATVGVDLSELKSGLASAQSETAAATAGMAGSFEKAGARIASANDNITRSSTRASGAGRVLGQQLSQVAQQGMATGQWLQAFSIQLPDIAVGMSMAGGEAGGLASILGGPLGIGIATVTALAIPLISNLLSTGDAASKSADKIDEMTAALGRLSSAQGRATRQDVGFAQADVFQKQGTVNNLQSQIAATPNTRAGAGQRAVLQKQLDAAQKELDSAEGLLAASKMRLQANDKLQAADEEEKNAKKEHSSSLSAAAKAQREQMRAENAAYRVDTAYRKDLGAANAGLLSAQANLTGSYLDRAAVERDQVQAAHDLAAEQIAHNRDYSAAQKADLLALNDQTLALKQRKIDLDEQSAREEAFQKQYEALMDVERIRTQNEVGLLSQQMNFAKTAADRQEIAIKIVELDSQLARNREEEIIASAERVIASQAATEAEKAAAEAAKAKAEETIKGIDAKLPGDIQAAKLQNPNILGAEDFGRALGDNLESGIISALKGKNLKDAMRDGIFNLLDRSMEEAFNSLSKAVFGQGGLGGFLSGLIGGLFGGKSHAVGGPVLGGMAYNVGDGEKFVPGQNGRILSRADAMAAAGGGGVPFHLSVTVSGARGNAEIMDMVSEGVKQGIGQYDRVVGSRVDRNYKRRA